MLKMKPLVHAFYFVLSHTAHVVFIDLLKFIQITCPVNSSLALVTKNIDLKLNSEAGM